MASDQSIFEGIWRIGESDGVLFPPDCLLSIREQGSGFRIEISVESEDVMFRSIEEPPYMEIVIISLSFPVFEPTVEVLNGQSLRAVYRLPGFAHPAKNEPDKLIYQLNEPELFMEISVCKSDPVKGEDPPRLYGLVVRKTDPNQPGTIERPALGGWGADKEGRGDDEKDT